MEPAITGRLLGIVDSIWGRYVRGFTDLEYTRGEFDALFDMAEALNEDEVVKYIHEKQLILRWVTDRQNELNDEIRELVHKSDEEIKAKLNEEESKHV